MRLPEALQRRVTGMDFGGKKIVVRDGKGFEDRVTVLADAVAGLLREVVVGPGLS